MTKYIRIPLYTLVALLALAAVSVELVDSSWCQRLLERRFIAGLESLTGSRVELGQFRFHPLTFQIVLHDVTLHGTEPPGEAPLFAARTVVVALGPSHLLHRRIRLRRLDWDGAELHLRVGADGSTNLPAPAAALSADKALRLILDLAIGRLTLSHTSIFWNDQRWRVDLRAENLAILLQLAQGSRYVGSLASSSLSVRSVRWSLPPLSLTSRFDLNHRDLILDPVTLQSEGLAGRASVTLRVTPTLEARYSFQGDADVPTLGRAFRSPILRAGNLRLHGEGTYSSGEVSARGRTQVQGLLLGERSFNPGRLDSSADFAIEHGRLHLSNLTAFALGGSARGKGEVALRESPPSVQLRTQLRDLDLAALLQAVSPRPLPFSHLHPVSRVDGAVDATWRGDLEALHTGFALDFRVPEAVPTGSLPVSGEMQGEASFDRGLTVSLRNADFRTPHSALSLHGFLASASSPSAVTINGVPRKHLGPVILSEAKDPSLPVPKQSEILRSAQNDKQRAQDDKQRAQHDNSESFAHPDNLQIELKTSDFEEWRPLFEDLVAASQPIPLSLVSPALFSGEFSGAGQASQVRGRLEMGEFKYRQWTWDKLTADVAASPSLVEISSARVRRGTSSFNLDVSAHTTDWRLAPDSPVRVQASARRTPLDNLKAAAAVEFPLSGFVSGEVSLQGTPAKLAGGGKVTIENGEISGEPFDSISAKVQVTESVWTFDDVRLAKGKGTMVGQAAYDPSRQYYSGSLKGTDFALTDFRRLILPAIPSGKFPPLEGRANLELRGEGTREEFQIHSLCNLEDIRISGTPVGDFRAQLDSRGQRWLLQGEKAGPGGAFQIAGEIRPAEGWQVELAGQYSDLRVDPWIRSFLDSKFSAGVTAGGSFKLAGTLKDPDKIELQGRAQTLEVSLPSSQWKNDQPVELRYASHVLSAGRFRMRGPATDLEVSGSVRLGEPAALSFDAEGKADATALSLLDPALKATGHGDLKLRVGGTPSRPLFNGTFDVQGVSLRFGDLPFQFSELNGSIRLDGEKATVSSLRGISGGGLVTLGGSVTFAEPLRLNLQAELEQVRVHYPADFTSLLNGNLRLEGTPDRGVISGELMVRQLLFNENANWLARLMEANSPFREQPVGVSSPLASRIRLNVRVSSAPPVRVESQQLRLVADFDLRLQGTLANPVEVGTIRLTSGEAVFRGNRYRLTRGDISFNNPIRTQATLDLEARTRVQRYDLMLDISGPFDRLKLAYRSDPPLPTADILSLLALGYTGHEQEEMSVLQTNPMRSVGASALLSEALSSQVTGRIQRLFGVSRIKIDPNVGAPGYGSGARVTVEQQLTPEFTVTYITNTAVSQYRIIQVEWALSEKVSLLGVRDQNGVFGLEVKFRQRFK